MLIFRQSLDPCRVRVTTAGPNPPIDPTLRQRCLQLFKSGIRDLRAVEGEPFQSGESFEMFQAGIRDLSVVGEVERSQTGETFDVFEPGIRDLGVAEEEPF